MICSFISKRPLMAALSFQSELSSKQIELSPSPAYESPIILRKILLGGQLQMHGEQRGIENVSIEIDDSRLAGRIGWSARRSATFRDPGHSS